MHHFTVFICLILITIDDRFTVNSEKNETKFVATNKWQILKKGQPIPRGLHVRYNFSTGITEAKLLENNEETNYETKAKSLVLQEDIPPNNIELWLKELKKVNDETSANLVEHNDNVENTFRSYEEIKEEFKSLKIKMTTDSEMMNDLFQRFMAYEKLFLTETLQKNNVESIIQILDDLEYFVHQIDNGQLFADMDGMTKIIFPCLDTSIDEIKMEALRVLGSAVQSNPKVQANALNNDLVQKLLHLLTSNQSARFRSRCLFALGALIRNFPLAQKAFIDHGGLEIFGKILDDDQLSVQLRIMKLVTDLADERDYIYKATDKSLLERKIHEYDKTDFEAKLVLHNYCQSLSNILEQSVQKSLSDNSTMEIYDFLEVTLNNMIAVSKSCRNEFRNKDNSLLDSLKKIMDYYNIINSTRSPEIEVFKNLAKQISRLRNFIFEDTHEEL